MTHGCATCVPNTAWGANAVDALSRFYELKAYSSAEPDTVSLTPAEFQRAVESDNFFLVVVSGLELSLSLSLCASSLSRSNS
jgi:hypothetical protein